MDAPAKIFLFTDRYPYGRGETFVDTELHTIAQAGTGVQVTVVPARTGQGERELPEGVGLCDYLAQPPSCRKIFAAVRTLFSKHLWSLFLSPRSPENARQWRNALGGLYRAYLTLLTVRKHRKFFGQADVLYSYWLDNTASGLAFAKACLKDFAGKPLVCRAHGYDVFEQERGVFFPARPFALNQAEKVFSVSRAGAGYLKGRYPEFAEKIECRHLGVEDRLCSPRELPENALRFVSCSNVIGLKRVGLISDYLKEYAVSHPLKQIRWTHFGAGPMLEEVKHETLRNLPPNFRAVFEGAVPNAKVLERYAAGEFDVFMSLSRSEGMPVSVIEAMSCAIPPLCTDAGGTGDAVDGNVGFLLPVDIKYGDFSRGTDDILAHYPYRCEKALSRQRERFSAGRNFTEFYLYLSSLSHPGNEKR